MCSAIVFSRWCWGYYIIWHSLKVPFFGWCLCFSGGRSTWIWLYMRILVQHFLPQVCGKSDSISWMACDGPREERVWLVQGIPGVAGSSCHRKETSSTLGQVSISGRLWESLLPQKLLVRFCCKAFFPFPCYEQKYRTWLQWVCSWYKTWSGIYSVVYICLTLIKLPECSRFWMDSCSCQGEEGGWGFRGFGGLELWTFWNV